MDQAAALHFLPDSGSASGGLRAIPASILYYALYQSNIKIISKEFRIISVPRDSSVNKKITYQQIFEFSRETIHSRKISPWMPTAAPFRKSSVHQWELAAGCMMFIPDGNHL